MALRQGSIPCLSTETPRGLFRVWLASSAMNGGVATKLFLMGCSFRSPKERETMAKETVDAPVEETVSTPEVEAPVVETVVESRSACAGCDLHDGYCQGCGKFQPAEQE